MKDPQDKQEIQTFAEEMCLTLLKVHAELASAALRAVQSKKLDNLKRRDNYWQKSTFATNQSISSIFQPCSVFPFDLVSQKSKQS